MGNVQKVNNFTTLVVTDVIPPDVGVWLLAFVLHFREGSDIVPEAGNPDWGFHGFPQSFQEDAG
jgi:hypothetical protein